MYLKLLRDVPKYCLECLSNKEESGGLEKIRWDKGKDGEECEEEREEGGGERGKGRKGGRERDRVKMIDSYEV